MKTPIPSSKRTRVRKILGFSVAVALGGALGWWFRAPMPLVGGSRPDSWRASWIRNRAYREIDPLDAQGFVRLTPENANGWYSLFREPLQTFANYQSQNPPRPTPQRRVIVLQPLGPFNASEKALIARLTGYCENFFQLPVRVASPLSLDVAKNYVRTQNARRKGVTVGKGQYDAGAILKHVLAPRMPEDAVAYIGVTMADLYADNLAFVFGLGSAAERTGIYSLGQYRPEFWGRPHKKDDARWLLRRSCLVLNHEIGHMLGISHCTFYKCSMNGCNSLVDADNTPLDYCPICHRKLVWNLGCDPTRRYADLLAFYRKNGLETEAKWTVARLARWKQLQARGYHVD